MALPPKFLAQAQEKADDPQHRKTMNFNLQRYHQQVARGQKQFADLDKARKLAKNIKWYALEELPNLLLEFETQFQNQGGKIIWAEDAEQALAAIREIAQNHQAKSIVKSKSMLAEEIGLNPFLEKLGLKVWETDLGEYIVQLRGEKPYHIVTPAMHLSRETIAQTFNQRFDLPPDASPQTIMAFVRDKLRKEFAQADIGITGANFLIAETGSIVITENEGNARLGASLPKVHIVLAGLEKILPSLSHLDLFLPLLASFGTGQDLTVYNTLYQGPRQTGEPDGPEQLYLILIDNGRSGVLAETSQRESLYCLKCGACLNACPVYKHIGGHNYQGPYPGPIGAALMPNLLDFDGYVHLSNASSLCGACTQACPVNINLHELLLDNRKHETDSGLKDGSEIWMWRIWKQAMLKRSFMNAPKWLKNWALRKFVETPWGQRRRLPQVQETSFNKLWRKGKV